LERFVNQKISIKFIEELSKKHYERLFTLEEKKPGCDNTPVNK
jgi:hypothetical protein